MSHVSLCSLYRSFGMVAYILPIMVHVPHANKAQVHSSVWYANQCAFCIFPCAHHRLMRSAYMCVCACVPRRCDISLFTIAARALMPTHIQNTIHMLLRTNIIIYLQAAPQLKHHVQKSRVHRSLASRLAACVPGETMWKTLSHFVQIHFQLFVHNCVNDFLNSFVII